MIDIETTGFSGLTDDRVIELAVVHTDPQGHITDRWTTLVNPGRDPGPTWLHGIHPDDLAEAPHFAELTDWLTNLLDGRVVVAHNAPYDVAFLTTEYERADVDPPDWPTLCTMNLARRLGTPDSLALEACCTAAGITLTRGHTALGDADATARLLRAYLSQSSDNGLRDLASLGCEKPLPPPDQAISTASPRLRPRHLPESSVRPI